MIVILFIEDVGMLFKCLVCTQIAANDAKCVVFCFKAPKGVFIAIMLRFNLLVADYRIGNRTLRVGTMPFEANVLDSHIIAHI